jgi:hypothetical protein
VKLSVDKEKTMKIWMSAVGMILAFAIFEAGCASTSKVKTPVPIGEIQNHPRNYAGKTVGVTGEVTNTFSLIFYKYFTLKDETGQIEVVTSKPLPRKGERITVEGTVDEGFSIGSNPRTVLREKG